MNVPHARFASAPMCAVILVAALYGAAPVAASERAPSPPATQSPATQSPLASEPFYAGIVTRARSLHSETEAFVADPSVMTGERLSNYERNVRALAAANMQGHEDLKARGTDNDLKCILKGVSLDLTIKIDALMAANTTEAKLTALDDMAYLLSDNIDVIVTPATAQSGMDCLIEFGP